jgi:hypothetical protein
MAETRVSSKAVRTKRNEGALQTGVEHGSIDHVTGGGDRRRRRRRFDRVSPVSRERQSVRSKFKAQAIGRATVGDPTTLKDKPPADPVSTGSAGREQAAAAMIDHVWRPAS